MPFAYGGQSQQRWGDNTVSQTEYMRDIQLVDRAGNVCNTADARKKGWIALAFIEPGETASGDLLPLLQKLSDAYKASGKLTVWVIAVRDETGQQTEALAKGAGLTAPILLDRDGYNALLFGVTTFPTLFVANGDGMVQRKMTGLKPAVLNDASAKFAAFAQLDGVAIVEGAPMPVVVAPPPAPEIAAPAA